VRWIDAAFLGDAWLDSPAATARLRWAAALQMNEIITIERMSNRKFLESHVLAGRVGLVGGTTLIEKVIRLGTRTTTNPTQRLLCRVDIWSAVEQTSACLRDGWCFS
jgi:hypothetical protein